MVNSKIKIAIAGVETVGKGLIDLLSKYKNKLSEIEISAIASRKKQEFKVFKSQKKFNWSKGHLSHI